MENSAQASGHIWNFNGLTDNSDSSSDDELGSDGESSLKLSFGPHNLISGDARGNLENSDSEHCEQEDDRNLNLPTHFLTNLDLDHILLQEKRGIMLDQTQQMALIKKVGECALDNLLCLEQNKDLLSKENTGIELDKISPVIHELNEPHPVIHEPNEFPPEPYHEAAEEGESSFSQDPKLVKKIKPNEDQKEK
ncbi:hypothetical protein HE1_00412 [Holospora elegans E1]|uniref:Uncharacterized protein n=1 Tax=Holospora elegans E1 TaxID=1427503 RepID=A0A023DYM1_9PROT|nr:hypothetical protein [Holospora elegans]GAJ46090.1 hypothetical protein HE1_00412 [Holospora elegans E1]